NVFRWSAINVRDLRGQVGMRIIIAAIVVLLLWTATGRAQETVHFPSLDGTTQLDGYVFLLVDSFRPRNANELCSVQGFDLELYRTRPKDAYGAFSYLQARPFVRGDRIGLMGWSQGGGATLFSIGNRSLRSEERRVGKGGRSG